VIRASLGIEPPPVIRGALQVQQFLSPLPRKVAPEELHLTLIFLGDSPLPELEAAHEELTALSAPGFTPQLEGLGLFGKDKPCAAWAGVAPSPALMELQARLETLARRAGCPVEARRLFRM
jgi:2'-5' RNA ligase